MSNGSVRAPYTPRRRVTSIASFSRRSFFNIGVVLAAAAGTSKPEVEPDQGVWVDDESNVIIRGKTVNLDGIVFVDGDLVVTGRVITADGESRPRGRAIQTT